MRYGHLKIEFYDELIESMPSDKLLNGNMQKEKYIRERIKDGRIYKFVKFTEDENLNLKKIDMLANQQFWASCYDEFIDKREVIRPYNKIRVQYYTGRTQNELDNFFSTLNEMNDISCFTYEPSDFMWEEYANNGNGFCMEFEVVDFDKFFPVIYLRKSKVKYTKDIINLLNSKQPNFRLINKVGIIPWVLKDKKYKKENELRFLCGDIYDQADGPMGGRIAAGKKKLLGYKGIEYSFAYAGLILRKVNIGSKCVKESELQEICKKLKIPSEKVV